MKEKSQKRIHTIIYIFVLLCFVLQLTSCYAQDNKFSVSSPNKNIKVNFWISAEKAAYYNIEFSGTQILQQSKLGLVREDGDFSQNLTQESASDVETVTQDYEMLQGKKSKYSYTGNKRTFHLANSTGSKMDIIFQVSNDGVAFQYYFPGNTEDIKKITEEVSTFNFMPKTKTWIQILTQSKTGWNQDQPSYEQYYQQDIELGELPPNTPGWAFPALFNHDKYWMLVSETSVGRYYCGGRLQRKNAGSEFFVDFPQKTENYPGGPVNPESTLPWRTPWRIIAIGDNLKTIVESTLGTDLATPSKLEDTSFVKPGAASWSWIMLKDDSIVYDVQKRFIDLAANMNWKYCLIDVNWDTTIGYEKIKELSEYAQSKNVGIILWYNSAGDWNTVPYHPKSKLLTHEDRVKEFTKLTEMGIKGVKVDFFGGDGQSMMAYYQDIFEDAAQFNIMVNCHGCTLPRGWQRTYPNLVTMEAIRGFEFVTFEQPNANVEANHSCVAPYTRNVFDPMDFTPVCFGEIPNIKRITTNGFELAVSVIFLSGVQHFAQTPESMANVPDYIQDFMREIPVTWDDTYFIDGYPGKLVVLARKSKNNWYIAGMNGENVDKSLSLDLDFLGGSKTGTLITEGVDNRTFSRREVTYTAGKPLNITLKGNGGFVIKIDN